MSDKPRVSSVPRITPVKDELSMTFDGEALKLIDRLKPKLLDADSRDDVVLRGLAVLEAADGKRVLVVDSDGSEAEVPLWRPKSSP